MKAIKYRVEKYRHFGNCVYLSNGNIELIVTLDFGPRVISLKQFGYENVFYEQPKNAEYLCTEAGWRLYGGHRLWLAPESEKTYYPDNGIVRFKLHEDGASFWAEHDQYWNVVKQTTLRFVDEHSLKVCHTIKNMSNQPLTTSLWAISAMAPESVVTIPLKGTLGGVAPNRFLSAWGSTSFSDERLSFCNDAAVICHKPSDTYFKMGFWCGDARICCESNGQIFCKTIETIQNAAYPDNHVNVEVFLCRHMMEFETLGSMVTIGRKCETNYEERWMLCPIDKGI